MQYVMSAETLTKPSVGQATALSSQLPVEVETFDKTTEFCAYKLCHTFIKYVTCYEALLSEIP